MAKQPADMTVDVTVHDLTAPPEPCCARAARAESEWLRHRTTLLGLARRCGAVRGDEGAAELGAAVGRQLDSGATYRGAWGELVRRVTRALGDAYRAQCAAFVDDGIVGAVEALKAERDEARDEAGRLAAEVRPVNEALVAANVAFRRQRDEFGDLSRHCKAVEGCLAHHARELKSAVADRDDARAAVARLKAERDQAEAERDQARADRDQARADRDQARTAAHRLHAELGRLKADGAAAMAFAPARLLPRAGDSVTVSAPPGSRVSVDVRVPEAPDGGGDLDEV